MFFLNIYRIGLADISYHFLLTSLSLREYGLSRWESGLHLCLYTIYQFIDSTSVLGPLSAQKIGFEMKIFFKIETDWTANSFVIPLAP